MNRTDLHIHFPAGAVGKDGPSAGSAISVALVSLFSGHCVRSDTAVTGEVTLKGLVLPVGGVKEKVLAAHRAGITHVILPKRNEKDLRDIPSSVKVWHIACTHMSLHVPHMSLHVRHTCMLNLQEDIRFTQVDCLEDVLANAFDEGIPTLRSKL